MCNRFGSHKRTCSRAEVLSCFCNFSRLHNHVALAPFSVAYSVKLLLKNFWMATVSISTCTCRLQEWGLCAKRQWIVKLYSVSPGVSDCCTFSGGVRQMHQIAWVSDVQLQAWEGMGGDKSMYQMQKLPDFTTDPACMVQSRAHRPARSNGLL